MILKGMNYSTKFQAESINPTVCTAVDKGENEKCTDLHTFRQSASYKCTKCV